MKDISIKDFLIGNGRDEGIHDLSDNTPNLANALIEKFEIGKKVGEEDVKYLLDF